MFTVRLEKEASHHSFPVANISLVHKKVLSSITGPSTVNLLFFVSRIYFSDLQGFDSIAFTGLKTISQRMTSYLDTLLSLALF